MTSSIKKQGEALWARLPNELWDKIFKLVFGSCYLRRHVVEEVQTMKLMSASMNDPRDGKEYERYAEDALIWTSTRLDQRERDYYDACCKPLDSMAALTPDFELGGLLTERAFLVDKPLDYDTFKTFCADPTSKEYQGRGSIVIESSPKAAFSKPPRDLCTPNLAPDNIHAWEEDDIEALQDRREPTLGLMAFDTKSYQDLCRLWTEQLKHLSPQVPGIRLIAKSVDLPFMLTGPGCITGKETAEIEQAVASLPGRDVDVDWLWDEWRL